MKVMPVDKVFPETVHIAFLSATTNPFFDIIKSGVDEATNLLVLNNCLVEYIIPGATQLNFSDYSMAIDTLVATGKYQSIVSFLIDETMFPAIDNMVAKGLVHATYDGYVPGSKTLFAVGQDLYAAGVSAGHAMAQLIEGKGKVAIITGWFGAYSLEQRILGFTDTIKAEYPNIEIVGTVENQDQADKAYAQTKDFLTANPDLAGIYFTGGGPIGGAQALEDLGKAGKVKIVCFDPLPQTVEYIKSGSIQAAIGANPFAEGRDSLVRVANYLMDGILPPYRYLWTRNDVVTTEELKAQYPNWKALTIDEFYATGQKG